MADGSSSIAAAAERRAGARGGTGRGRRWLAEMVSVFFPSGCRICERLLTSASQVPLCEECLSSFARVPGTACEVCGRPLAGLSPEPEQPLLCPACQNRKYAFDRARSFALYEEAVVQAILLKFEQIEPLGTWFAERLAELVSAEADRQAADVVVPVPLHRERERERGYNQAAPLSNPLAKRLRLPLKAVLSLGER